MIGFDVSAVRAIIFTVVVYIGIGTPPILIEQTKQLIDSFPSSSDLSASNQQLFSSSNDFSLSLEWTLFNPNGGFCPAKNPPHFHIVPLLDGLNSTKIDQSFEESSPSTDESFQRVSTSPFPEICLIKIIFTLPVCYCDNTSFVSVADRQSDLEVSNLDSEQPRKDAPQDFEIYYISSVHDTPGHLDFEIPLLSDFDLLISEDDSITRQDSTVHSQLDLSPVDLFDETNCSTSLSTNSDYEQPLFSDDDPVTPQDFEVSFQIPTMDLCPVDLFDETNHSTSLSTDNEYQPLPGSDSGVLWYHEQLRANLRNAILSSLPETWTKWITSNRPTLGIICVTVMYISLLWPLLFVLWRQVKSKRRMTRELSVANGVCHIKDSQVSVLKREKGVLTEKLAEATTHSLKMEELLKSRTQDLLLVNQDELLVKAKLCNVSNSLSAAQDQISQQLSQIKRLEGETQDYSDRMAQRDSECSHLIVRMANLTEEKQSLETENLLVKYAKEATVTSLATLQTDHEQTKRDLVEAKEAHAALESQLSSLTEELNTNNTKLCEQERELKELSDCLNQVTSQTAELAFLSSESVLDEEVALPAVCLNKCSKDVQLSSIQDVLDGFQVEIAQQQCKEHIRQLNEELEKKESLLEECDVENRNLKQQVSLLQAASKIYSDQLVGMKLKMKGITDYFHSKEDNLQRKLIVSESKLQQFELLNSEALEKQLTLKEQIEREQKDCKDSKQQLHAVIKSLQNQVQVNTDRADKAMKCTRFTEQELRLANREIVEVKKRLREVAIVKSCTQPLDGRLPSAPHAPVPRKTSVVNRDRISSPSRLSCVLLTHRANQSRKTFQLTSTKLTPTRTSKHAPSHPSPLLQTIVLSEGEKKKLEIATVTGISCSPSYTAAASVAQSTPVPNVVPQCDMESIISKAEEASPRADVESENDKSSVVTVTLKKAVKETTPIEDAEFNEPARDILLSYSNIIRPWSSSDQYY